MNGNQSGGDDCYSSVVDTQPAFGLIFVFEFPDVTTDHDKGDGKVQEDPDGGHHDIDAPPRPLKNQHNKNAIHPEV